MISFSLKLLKIIGEKKRRGKASRKVLIRETKVNKKRQSSLKLKQRRRKNNIWII